MQKSTNYAMRQMPVGSLNDIEVVAEWVHKSGILGKNTNPAMCKLVTLSCYQEGVSIQEFVRRNDVVEDGISVKAKIKLADFLALGGEYVCTEYTDSLVTIQLSYKGRTQSFSASIDDLTEKGIATTKDGKVKSNYRKFGRKMLWSRAISEGCDIIAPESSSVGIYTTEERQDFSQRNVEMVDAEPVAYEYQPYTAIEDERTDINAIEAPVDPSICSIECQFKGQKWEALSSPVLERALTLGLDTETTQYIQHIIELRAQEEEEV